MRRKIQNEHEAAGVEGGGDWIRSTNLGDHALGRVSGFGEWRQVLASRVQLDAALRAAIASPERRRSSVNS